jgi:hypothetical protein
MFENVQILKVQVIVQILLLHVPVRYVVCDAIQFVYSENTSRKKK